MLALLRARFEELKQALRDPGRPMPAWIWFGLAALLSLAFFLWLRLVAVRTGAPERRAGAATPASSASAPSPAPSTPTTTPSASREAIAARIESWRKARATKDLRGWLDCYARTYGAAGLDLAALAERAAHEFSDPQAPAITISGLEVSGRQDIVIASLIETRVTAGVEVRSQVRLYLLAADGQWRIFNEERAAIERGSEAP